MRAPADFRYSLVPFACVRLRHRQPRRNAVHAQVEPEINDLDHSPRGRAGDCRNSNSGLMRKKNRCTVNEFAKPRPHVPVGKFPRVFLKMTRVPRIFILRIVPDVVIAESLLSGRRTGRAARAETTDAGSDVLLVQKRVSVLTRNPRVVRLAQKSFDNPRACHIIGCTP